MATTLEKHLIVGRRGLLAGAGGFLASPAIVRAQGKASGVALVIGNSKYQWETQLPNVKRDAPDIAKRFEALGLKTELVADAGLDAMRAALTRFVAAARGGAGFAAFYFAGHGVNDANNSYLVPVDADLSNPRNIKDLVPVGRVREGMKGVPHSLLVFDDCRNSPADRWKQAEAEEGASITVEAQAVFSGRLPNMLMMFSTAPGRIALDGPAGQNSPFCAALLRQLNDPALDIQALPARIRRDLLLATEGQQVMFDLNTYTGPFPMKAAGAVASAGPSPPTASIVELPNAYAFAKQNDLPMPPGLVALRPPAKDSPHYRRVGSYLSQNSDGRPFLLLVTSVNEQNVATIVFMRRTANQHYWRLATGKLSGNSLTYHATTKSGYVTYTWRDENSGTLRVVFGDSNSTETLDTTFKRLDG